MRAPDTADEAPIYDEPGRVRRPRWPVSRLTALFSGAAGALRERWRDSPRRATCCRRTRRSTSPDQDWVRATQAQFAPIRITAALWIVPSWCDPVDPAAINLALDPGLAFGTGSHPTTRLCLRWLATRIARRRIGARLRMRIRDPGDRRVPAGREPVVGTDIDPQAIVASRANAKRNGVDATFVPVDELPADEAPFDVVVANILANPLIALAPALARRLRRGGRIVLSGILDAQADAVIDGVPAVV